MAKSEIFFEGLATAEKDGKMLHILPDGTPAYEERFEVVWPFKNGLALVKNGSYSHIKHNGAPFYETRFGSVVQL